MQAGLGKSPNPEKLKNRPGLPFRNCTSSLAPPAIYDVVTVPEYFIAFALKIENSYDQLEFIILHNIKWLT
jgi:hypothetical protein